MEHVAVRAETQEGEREATVVVTLEGSSWQVNIRAHPRDWERLTSVSDTDWSRRRAVRLGSVEGSAVWWHVSDDVLHLNVGDGGPEASDLAFVVSLSALRDVQAVVAAVDDDWG
ncbi:hypothetical protein [Nocardioides aestuarii]|uniref:SsgA family sporulation/cell division regulator n=1 Tax=Nocardioides aestuarii TaxID=252231 RepID=A0ABW4TJR5_9ACTN